MAKAQFPIDGKLGKDFKVTSYMGYRIHPIKKVKKFHTGTDIWSKHEPCVIEVPYDGKIIKVSTEGAYGNHVIIRHVIQGKTYVTLYGHMKAGSIKVKKGQVVTAGTAIGKMGSTGMSTGKHLHWELQAGKNWVWSDTGKNFIEPIKFFTNLIAFEASVATAPVEAKETDPVAPAPTHDDAGAKAASNGATVDAPAPVIKPVEPKLAPAAPKSIDYKSWAKRVIRGEFGNGAERVAALKAAGLSSADIKRVQATVNELL